MSFWIQKAFQICYASPYSCMPVAVYTPLGSFGHVGPGHNLAEEYQMPCKNPEDSQIYWFSDHNLKFLLLSK